MNRRVVWSAVAALALLTFFQFPGHTYLQQDSQIYVPILENLRDPSVLRNDILTQHPHVAFTLYDETALLLRKVTGLRFHEILAAQQLVTRALGIWGLYLMAAALGFSTWRRAAGGRHLLPGRRDHGSRGAYFRIRADAACLRRAPAVVRDGAGG